MNQRIRTFARVVLCSAVTLWCACTIKDDLGSLVNPGGVKPGTIIPIVPPVVNPSLVLSSDSAYVRIGDTLAIRILVLRDSTISDSSKPLSRALVRISSSQGKIVRDSVITDTNGRALVYFTDSTEHQNVLVTASCYGSLQTLRLDVTNTTDKIQKLIAIWPESPSIKADGSDFTYINVRVLNEQHNPVPAGEPVQFITTAGVIAGIDPPSASLPGQSKVGPDGLARAKLTSTPINDTAFVTAVLLSDRSKNAETRVAFLGVSIVVRADSSNLATGAKSRLTATVLNGSGVPVANTPIYFLFGKGITSNLSFEQGSVDTVTGFDGNARATITGSATGSDSVVIIAAGARTGFKINVTNLSLKLVAEAALLQARRDTTWVHATFSQNNGALLASKVIRLIKHSLSSSGSEQADTVTALTNANGVADFKIPALAYDGTIRLEATGFESSGNSANAELQIKCVATRVMTINALPSVILADGTSQSKITVQIKNEVNNPLVGDKINFISDAGMVVASAITNEDGKAIAALTSDRRNFISTVTATLDRDPTRKITAQVEFAGVALSAAAAPVSISSSGKDTSTVTVTLIDANRNPIVGEIVNVYRQQPQTTIIPVDSATNNRGESHFKVAGTGVGIDTISFKAAGASATVSIYYSTNILKIDTVSAAGSPHSYLANGHDSTRISISYLKGDQTTPISGALLEISVTLGTIAKSTETVFAETLTTDGSGNASFYLKNPDFANTASIAVKAKSTTEITSTSISVYFKASRIHRIVLTGTPEVISTNGDRSKITAIAYDSTGNRVKDATISFNLANGPGGGEFLDPPTAITGYDGSAVTYLKSGTIPSNFREVWVVAGEYGAIKSDTAKFTIAGPPKYITIRRNIGKLVNNNNGTYSMKVAAIVSDINGNPVADGTEVTFGMKMTAYIIYKIGTNLLHNQYSNNSYSGWDYYYNIDTIPEELTFEDLNDNYHLDPGEDNNRDGWPNRGEDVDGDGKFNPGPGFEDINWNGRRDTLPEPGYYWISYDSLGSPVARFTYADLNRNGRYDTIEPLLGGVTEAQFKAAPGYDSIFVHDGQKGGFHDMDWNNNGVPDPATAATITRTIQTVGGVAENIITYGQSDALRVRVMLTAEAQGCVALSPENFILPILDEDFKYWTPRP